VREGAIACYRWGAGIDGPQFDRAVSAAMHAVGDGEALEVCPECQKPYGTEMVDDLRR
jgi:hypothetical protein